MVSVVCKKISGCIAVARALEQLKLERRTQSLTSTTVLMLGGLALWLRKGRKA